MSKREDILKDAYNLIKQGHNGSAEIRLQRYLRHHKRDATAWWLLANATQVPDRKRGALETVVKLNPDHEKARALLEKMPAPPPTAHRNDGMNKLLNVLIAIVGGITLIVVGALILPWASQFLQSLPQGETIVLFEAEVSLPTPDPDNCGIQLLGPPRVGRLRGISTDNGEAAFTDCSDQHVWVLDARADENYAITLDPETEGLLVYVLRVDSPPEAASVDVNRGRGSSPTGATAFFRTNDQGDYRIVVARRAGAANGTYTIASQRR